MAEDFRHLLGSTTESGRARRLAVFVVSLVGFVGGAVAFFKNLDDIEKLVPTAWEMLVSKPELNVRDVKIDVTEFSPDTPVGAPKPTYKTYNYFIRVYAVLEKKSIGRIENCRGEMKEGIDETKVQTLPETSNLYWGRYDQPAKFQFLYKSYPIELKTIDFRILCDGLVSGWTSRKLN